MPFSLKRNPNPKTSVDRGLPLEEILRELERHGEPRLSLSKSSMGVPGWHCYTNMDVAASGARFEIKSEFGHPDPSSAARECLQRVQDCLKQM